MNFKICDIILYISIFLNVVFLLFMAWKRYQYFTIEHKVDTKDFSNSYRSDNVKIEKIDCKTMLWDWEKMYFEILKFEHLFQKVNSYHDFYTAYSDNYYKISSFAEKLSKIYVKDWKEIITAEPSDEIIYPIKKLHVIAEQLIWVRDLAFNLGKNELSNKDDLLAIVKWQKILIRKVIESSECIWNLWWLDENFKIREY